MMQTVLLSNSINASQFSVLKHSLLGNLLFSPLTSILKIFNEINDFISKSDWRIQDWGPKMVAILMLNTSQ